MNNLVYFFQKLKLKLDTWEFQVLELPDTDLTICLICG